MHRSRSRSWSATRKPLMTAAASSTAISATISDVRRSWRSCARRGRSRASRIGERSRPTGITTGSASEARNSKSSIRWGRKPRRPGRTDEAIFKLLQQRLQDRQRRVSLQLLPRCLREECPQDGGRLSRSSAGVGRIQEWITHGRGHSRDHRPSFLESSMGSGTQEQL